MVETIDFIELSPTDCLRLLGAGVIGRVVFTESAMPAAQPVTYLLDGEEIVFRTRNGSKLAAATWTTPPGTARVIARAPAHPTRWPPAAGF